MKHDWVQGELTYSRKSILIDEISDFIFTSFNDYRTCASKACFLNIDQDRDVGYFCTCKKYARELSCINSVGVAILRGNLIPFGRKIKPE